MFWSELYNMNLRETLENISDITKLDNRKILITGATGLIGSAIVDTLMWHNRSNHADITIYIAGRNENAAYQRFHNNFEEGHLKFLQYDAISELRFDVDFDYIIHAASNAHPMAYSQQPVETMLGNLIGTNNLLDYAVKHNVSRLLYISSGEVYGNKSENTPYTEQDYGFVDFLNPRACYPSSKRAAETMCVSYMKQHQLDVVIARPGHIYGPTMTDTDSRASAQFARDAGNGRDIIMKSPGLQLRSYCYVFDCASAILTILLDGKPGQAYNVANRESVVTIRQLAQAFADHGNVSLVFETPSDEEVAGYNLMPNSVLDSEKLYDLGWRGIYDLNEGVKRTVELLKQKGGIE